MHLIIRLFAPFANLLIQRRVGQVARNLNPHTEEHPQENAGMRRAFLNLYLNAGQVAENRDIILPEVGGVAPMPEPRAVCYIAPLPETRAVCHSMNIFPFCLFLSRV